MSKFLIVFILCVSASSMLIAGGFNLYEFGARSSTMGGAAVAQAYDASTIFYNPSGLAFLPGTNFYGGATLVGARTKFSGADPILAGEEHTKESELFSPVGIYFSHAFSEKFAAGVGVTNPFGLGVKWADDFPGRGISKKSQIISYYVSPVIAFRLTPELSIGGGPDFVYASVDLIRNIYLFGSPGSIGYEVGESELKGNSKIGVGFSASMMYKTERAAIGLLYRHSVKNNIDDGDAKFSFFDNASVPGAVAVAKAAITDQKVSTEIEFPNFLSFGAYYRITPKLGAEVDVIWFRWEVVDQLVIDFVDLDDITIPLNYSNSWQVRAGVHFDPTEKLSFRAGYIYDQSPQPIESVSPLLPDADRNDLTFGLGYNFGRLQVDAGYMAVLFKERSTVEDGVGKNQNGFDGTYDTQADLFFLSLGVKIK